MAFIVKSTLNCNLKNPSLPLKLVIKMPLKPLQKDSRNIRLPTWIFLKIWGFQRAPCQLGGSWVTGEGKNVNFLVFFSPHGSLWLHSPRFLQCHLVAGNSFPSLLPTFPEFDPFWEAAFGIPSQAHNPLCSSFKQGNKTKKKEQKLHRKLNFQPHSLQIWFMSAAQKFGHLQISQNLKNKSNFPFLLLLFF